MTWDRRWVWAALGVTALLIAASIWQRPLWRDEYWALYFSDPASPLRELVFQKIVKHEHPPAYFALLYLWRFVWDNDVWARVLNLAFDAAAAWTIWRLGRDRPRETGAFLLIAATSYWVIFFAAEIRMYALMFAGCAVSCFAARRALQGDALKMAGVFAIFGFFTALSQVFGAMWIGLLGGWMTLAFLWRRNWSAAATWTLATALGVGPALAWVAMVRPDEIYHTFRENRMLIEAGLASTQFFRGLVVKTFGSNLLLYIAAFFGITALIRKKDAFDVVLGLSVLSGIVIPFAFHIFIEPMIKERGFIVIMPAVMLLAVRAVESLSENQKTARRLVGWIPIAAMISPLFFAGEYFKDREHLGEARRFVAENAAACAQSPIAIYYREAVQGADWSRYVAHRAFKGAANGHDLNLVDLDALTAPPAAAPGCPIRAIAPMLPRGETDLHEQVRAELRARGFDLNALDERRLGDGRTLVFVARP